LTSNKVLIRSLHNERLKVRRPIPALLTQFKPRGYTANAPALGLWCPGFGSTKEEAVRDLSDAIVSLANQLEVIDLTHASGYAIKMRAALQCYVAKRRPFVRKVPNT
jgi:hypothetical protein